MGTCYGRFLSRGINLFEKSPYRAYISANNAVNPRDIYEKFGEFFQLLIEGDNVVEAYLKMHKNGSDFYYKDSKETFEQAFQSLSEKLKKDPKLRQSLLNEYALEMKNMDEDALPSEEWEGIMKTVMLQMYQKQKKTYIFD